MPTTKELNIFEFLDYRDFFQSWYLVRSEQQRGLLSRLAQALDCQNSHITRVLQQKLHLTMDQAYRMTKAMALNRTQENYFMKLVEHNRAGDVSYRLKLEQDLQALREEQENFARRHRIEQVEDPEFAMRYYSSWHWLAVHFLTEIRRYQNVARISERLGMREEDVLKSLHYLESKNLVRRQGDAWIGQSRSIHLPKQSPMNSVSHSNWRQRAVLDSQRPEGDSLHYTVVQAIGEKDFEKIKQQLLATIDNYRKTADAAPSEELICFALDFFKV